jgi:hypothetical protein
MTEGSGMKTYNREQAEQIMKTRNHAYRLAGNKRDLAVLVEGPGEGEATVMPLKESIENEFAYSWA